MTSAPDKSLILFDGVCNLCQSTVQWVIRNDRNGRFRFASLQSPAAALILEDLNYQNDQLSSVLLVENGSLYRKSCAALRITKALDGFWPIFYYLFFWIPPFLADPIYDFIGNRRYRWFGKKDKCWLPEPGLASRFIDDGIAAVSARTSDPDSE